MEPLIFLDVEDVLEIHRISLEKYGGQDGLRDYRLLESAVYQPQQTFDGQPLYASISIMAAVYAFHLAENQPFFDGNKRTAFASSLVFLKLNGYKFTAANIAVYRTFIDLANKTITKDDLINWYCANAFAR